MSLLSGAREEVDFSLLRFKMELEAKAVDQETPEHEALFCGRLRVAHGDVAGRGVFRRNGVDLEPLRRGPIRAAGDLVILKVEGIVNEHPDVSAKKDAPAWVTVKAGDPAVGLGIGRLDGCGVEGGEVCGGRCRLRRRARRGEREGTREKKSQRSSGHLSFLSGEIIHAGLGGAQ